jgi:hypothetical protein
LNKARALMLFSMRKVLTRDQWAKFTALHLAAERERNKDSNGKDNNGKDNAGKDNAGKDNAAKDNGGRKN